MIFLKPRMPNPHLIKSHCSPKRQGLKRHTGPPSRVQFALYQRVWAYKTWTDERRISKQI